MAAVHAWVTFLLNAAWQICLLAIIAGVCSLLARRARASLKHSIWVMALLGSAVLPVLSLASHERSLTAKLSRGNSIADFRQEIDNSLWHAGEDSPRGYEDPRVWARRLLAPALVVSYFVSLVLGLGRLILRWRRTRLMLAAARSEEVFERPVFQSEASARRLCSISDDCRRRLGLSSVSIICSGTSQIPFTAGALRSVVVLPHSLIETASDEELSAAISHELAHISRRDYLLNILYETISLTVAFHPSVLWMKRQVERTRELACDEMAASSLGNSNGYARALVSLARALPLRPLARVAGPALGVFDGNNLEERIMQLLDRKPRLKPRAATAVLAVSFLTVSATCVLGYNFALAAGPQGSRSTAGQSDLSGVWTGDITERGSDGATKGHSSLCLRIQQRGNEITGQIGDKEPPTTPLEHVVLSWNHLSFSATTSGDRPIVWTLELDVKGDSLEGWGHAFRSSDNHSWGGQIKLMRNN